MICAEIRDAIDYLNATRGVSCHGSLLLSASLSSAEVNYEPPMTGVVLAIGKAFYQVTEAGSVIRREDPTLLKHKASA